MIKGQSLMIPLLKISIQEIIQFYRGFGEISASLLTFSEVFIPFLPLGAFVALNASAYGLVKGFLFSWLGSVLGSWLLYGIIRYFHHYTWMKRFTRSKQFLVIHEKFEQHGMLLAFVLYIIPVFPNSLMTIVAGVNKMDFIKFAISSSLGIAISFLIVCYGAANITWFLANPLFLLPILLSILVYMIISRKLFG